MFRHQSALTLQRFWKRIKHPELEFDSMWVTTYYAMSSGVIAGVDMAEAKRVFTERRGAVDAIVAILRADQCRISRRVVASFRRLNNCLH